MEDKMIIKSQKWSWYTFNTLASRTEIFQNQHVLWNSICEFYGFKKVRKSWRYVSHQGWIKFYSRMYLCFLWRLLFWKLLSNHLAYQRNIFKKNSEKCFFFANFKFKKKIKQHIVMKCYIKTLCPRYYNIL